MIIGIDGTSLQGERSGAGWYLTYLLEALSHVLEEDKLYVWMNNPTAEDRARVSENRFVALSVTHYPWAALKLTWSTLNTPCIDTLIGRPADLYFFPNFYLSIPQKQAKKVFYIHDLTHLIHPEMVTGASLKNTVPNLEKEAGKADLLLTSTEYNRQEMLRIFRNLNESKIRVIPFGVPEPFRGTAPAEKVREVQERYRLARPYFLFADNLEPRQNLLRLVHAFLLFKQRFQNDHELVLAGPKGSVGEDFIRFVLSPQMEGKVRWLENVPSDELPALLTGASAFLYPSLREGFGMPLLEAMGCGTPILCSTTSVMPEIVGDAAWLIEPGDVDKWAKAMERVLTEPAFTAVLKEKAKTRISLFRMENTAKQTLAVWKMVQLPRF